MCVCMLSINLFLITTSVLFVSDFFHPLHPQHITKYTSFSSNLAYFSFLKTEGAEVNRTVVQLVADTSVFPSHLNLQCQSFVLL